MRSQPRKQWSYFSLCPQIRLSVIFPITNLLLLPKSLLRNSEPHFKSFEHLIIGFLWRRFFQLGVLFLPLFFKLYSLWYIERIRSEKSVYFFFELWNIVLLKSILKNFGWEDHHCLIEILVWFLIGKDFGLELHERSTMLHLLGTYWPVLVDYPGIVVCHKFGFFWKLLLLWREHLWDWKTSLFGFLL